MKLLYAVLLAAAFTAPACDKKKDAAKTDPAAKTADPAKADPATPDPAKADPAKADPAKADPAKVAASGEAPKADSAKPWKGKTGSQMTVDEAGAMSIEFADKIVAAIEGSGGDCAKMGASLKAIDAEVREVAAIEKDFDTDATKKAEFKKKYEPQIDAKMKAAVTKLEACMTNADVKGFIDAMATE